MAEAMTLEQEKMEIPDGGIASFVSADDEYYDSPDRLVPEGGVTDLMQAADQLAQLGRNEDSFIVHASLGEHVIPMQVFEDKPELKDAVFAEMREKGLDPEQYIVGNELNSINPETGLPEFGLGFIKKIRKKIGKGIKKIGKGIVKVVKKAAPIILPIALGMIPGVGPVLAASLGSGIGTLAQGASFKDALKTALISGATAGLVKGVQGGFAAKANNQTFMSGFRGGVEGAIGGTEQFTALKDAATKVGQGQNPFSVEALRGTIENTGVDATRPPVQFIEDASTTGTPITASEAVQQAVPPSTVDKRSFMESMEGFLNPSKDQTRLGSLRQAFFPASDPSTATQRALEMANTDVYKNADSATKQLLLDSTKEAYTPTLMRTAAPKLGAAALAAAPLGFFDAPEEEPMDPAFGGVTSDQLIAGDPGKYVPGVPVDPPAYATLRDVRVANQGGEMFPRKTGYINGPGTETSDSVPAMLSDGEFVFTAKAVRGAGNGSRQNGVRNMYQMMKNFETQAA